MSKTTAIVLCGMWPEQSTCEMVVKMQPAEPLPSNRSQLPRDVCKQNGKREMAANEPGLRGD